MKVAVILLVACAGLAGSRVRDWRDDRTLWTATTRVSPSPRAFVNLAAVELREGRYMAALQADATAITLQHGRLDDKRFRFALAMQLRWITAFGFPACITQPYALWC